MEENVLYSYDIIESIKLNNNSITLQMDEEEGNLKVLHNSLSYYFYHLLSLYLYHFVINVLIFLIVLALSRINNVSF